MSPNTQILLVKLHCSGQIIPLTKLALVFSGSVEFAGKNPFDFDVQFSLTTLFVCMLDSSGLEEGWL